MAEREGSLAEKDILRISENKEKCYHETRLKRNFTGLEREIVSLLAMRCHLQWIIIWKLLRRKPDISGQDIMSPDTVGKNIYMVREYHGMPDYRLSEIPLKDVELLSRLGVKLPTDNMFRSLIATSVIRQNFVL